MNIDCQNGGFCVRSDSGHGECQCTAGYRGPSCTESDCDNYCKEVWLFKNKNFFYFLKCGNL